MFNPFTIFNAFAYMSGMDATLTLMPLVLSALVSMLSPRGRRIVMIFFWIAIANMYIFILWVLFYVLHGLIFLQVFLGFVFALLLVVTAIFIFYYFVEKERTKENE